MKATLDIERVRAYFEKITGQKMPLPKVKIKADNLLREFILKGGFEIEL